MWEVWRRSGEGWEKGGGVGVGGMNRGWERLEGMSGIVGGEVKMVGLEELVPESDRCIVLDGTWIDMPGLLL